VALTLLFVAGVYWLTFKSSRAPDRAEDEARAAARNNVDRLRQAAADGKLADEELDAIGWLPLVRREPGRVVIIGVTEGRSPTWLNQHVVELCVEYSVSEPLGPGSRIEYREVACQTPDNAPSPEPTG
jgi:hypothetical protein